MPHVVFDKRINLEELFEKFSPIMKKEPCLIKITEMYIDNEKRKMLLPTVVIDEKHQDFLIEISTNEQKTTVRLYPRTDPEKTDGVKSSLGLVAAFIDKTIPGLSVSKTNISDFIPS